MRIKMFLNGGKTPEDPFEDIKRMMFLVATPVGSLIMLLVWEIGLRQHSLTASDVFFLPFLAILFLVLVVLLWRKVIHLRSFELIVYALVLVYALCEFASIIITVVFTKNPFVSDFSLWLPFVYILSFLFLSTNRALLLSAFFLLSILVLGLSAYMNFLFQGLAFPNTSLLLQVYFASLCYIAVLYLVAHIKDLYISQQAVADDMSKLAMIDSLTQVDNRRLLNKSLEEEVNRAERHNTPFSILLLDLDRFKRINDTYGHNTGDKVLHEVAQQLRQNVRTSDPFGRWGGDEFLCLAINSDGEHAVELAERLRLNLQQHQFEFVKKVTASFGVTTFQKGDTPETLVRRADLGLYKAKTSGRNRVEEVVASKTLPLFEGEKPDTAPDGKTD